MPLATLGDEGCRSFFARLGGGFRDAEVALGPFVEDVVTPATGPRGEAAEKISPDSLRESAIEAGIEGERPIA
jgi:hypothetical protein